MGCSSKIKTPDDYGILNPIGFKYMESLRYPWRMRKMAEEKNKPLFKVRAGGVCATVWNNVSKEDKKEYQSISLEKSYKVGEEWKTTNNYMVNDLKDVMMVCEAVLKQIRLKVNE